MWLFPLSLLGQLPHSQLYVAASCHPDYQISMTENSCFNFFFCGSSLKKLIIFLKPFFLKSEVIRKFFIWKCYYQNQVIFILIGWYIKLTTALQKIFFPNQDIQEKSLQECKKAINNFIIKLSTNAQMDWLVRDKCWC